jgi:hypothetical protein
LVKRYPKIILSSSRSVLARKMVAYLLAVDRSQQNFLVAENENRSAA